KKPLAEPQSGLPILLRVTRKLRAADVECERAVHEKTHLQLLFRRGGDPDGGDLGLERLEAATAQRKQQRPRVRLEQEASTGRLSPTRFERLDLARPAAGGARHVDGLPASFSPLGAGNAAPDLAGEHDQDVREALEPLDGLRNLKAV